MEKDFLDFCATPLPPRYVLFYPCVIQVFYDRYFRFVSLVAKKAHMPASAFRRKAPEFPLTPRAENNSSLAIHLLFDETEVDNTQKCLY